MKFTYKTTFDTRRPHLLDGFQNCSSESVASILDLYVYWGGFFQKYPKSVCIWGPCIQIVSQNAVLLAQKLHV